MEYQMLICRDPQDGKSRRELFFQAVSLYVRDQEGLEGQNTKLEYTEKGKPYLTYSDSGQPVNRLQCSISHSGGLWSCLLGPKVCGLDIQENRPLDCEKLAARFFTEREQHYVKQEGLEGFYQLWCRREALAKYTGLGFFGMSEKRPELADSVILKPSAEWEGRRVWFHEIHLEEGFTAVWCSEGEDDEVRCIR